MNLKEIKKSSFPTINFIGNKEKIADWICENLPKDAISLFDAFSGGGSVSYFAKQKGLKVISNDVMAVNYLISKALVENSDERLTEEDAQKIFTGRPIKGFMFNNYANVYYFPKECMELDLYRKNIEKLSSEYKKALAFSLLRRAMIRKMPYSRFTLNWEKIKQLRDEKYSYKKYKRKRAYHNKSFQYHFLKYLDEHNNAVFSNGKQNKAYNSDIFDILGKVKSDVIYLDPPYTATMNNYYGFYGVIDEYINSKKSKPFKNNFIEKANSLVLFDKLFSNLTNFRYWVLSYNNNSYPSKEDLYELLKKYSTKVRVIERQHVYKITGKEKKNKNKEYLFIVENN